MQLYNTLSAEERIMIDSGKRTYFLYAYAQIQDPTHFVTIYS
jgi:hypothetical protein